tara:strand:+ start:535 stop:795 length:261 start_codon:yes stop_codon:yes gene_type:complete
METLAFLVLGGLLAIAIIAGVNEAIKQSEQHFKDAESKPSMNTNNWEQHQRRLDKFGESKFRDTHFYVGPKGGVYYITYRGTKVYC